MTAHLAHRALHALKWRYAGTVCQVGLQFTVGVVLARLVSPEGFGVVGLALLAIGFGRSLGDLGFGEAIIQRPSLTHKHIRAAWTGNTMVSGLLFGLLWVGTPPMVHLFTHDGLTPILRTLGLSLLFSGMSTTPLGLLRRELRFRAIAGIEIASYGVGFGVVGVSLALGGYGVWSLVAAHVVQPFCLLILALYVTPLPLCPWVGVQEYRDLFRVAGATVLNNVTTYFAERLDFLVLGKCLGASALGLYTRSFYVMDVPVRYFSAELASVMFPLYAQIQDDIPRLGGAFLRTVSLTAVVIMPVLFAMATVPGIILGGLLGAQWKGAAGTLQLLCLGGPFMALIHVFSAVSHARGYVFSECRRQPLSLVVMGVAVWVLLPYGIEGVAGAVVLATLTRYLLLAHLSLKLVGVRWGPFLRAQAPGGLLGMAVATSVYLASVVGDRVVGSDVLKLLLMIAVALLSWIVSSFLCPASWLGDVYLWILERFGAHLPSWLRTILAAKGPAVRSDAVDANMDSKLKECFKRG